MQIMQDEPVLAGLTITRVELSPNKSKCTIFFHALGGMEDFEKKRKILVFYKPSLRKAFTINSWTIYSSIRFAYDAAA